MKMTIQKSALLCFLIGALVPFQTLYADECDDAYHEAGAIYDSAKEALNEKDYERAADLYEAAAAEYEKVSAMKGCRCPKIAGSSRKQMASCQDSAAKYRKQAEKQEAFEEYNRARDRFNEGNDYARNGEWDNAIDAFEEAAEIWEGIADTETENGRLAAKMTKQARDAADLARERQEDEE